MSIRERLKRNHSGQKISLIRTFSVLLLLFYTFSLIAGFYSCYHFVHKAAKTTEEERAIRAEQKVSELEKELDNYSSQLNSLYQRTVSDNNRFLSNNTLEILLAKRNMQSNLVDYMGQFPAIKLFYYEDEQRGISLHNRNCSVDEIGVMDYLRNAEEIETGSYSDNYWRYVEYMDYQYLYLVNQNGGTKMGILVGLDRLLDECNNLILMDEEGFLVYRDDTIIYRGELSMGTITDKLMRYEVFAKKLDNADIEFRYYYDPYGRTEFIDSTIMISFLFVILEFVFYIYAYRFMKKYLVKPIHGITRIMKNVENGDYQVRADLTLANSEETFQLAKTMNQMLDEVVNLRVESYERIVREQGDRLRMLRSQLRPHFYLNAINTINSMTYKENNEEHIREYLYALSTHMRFMMRMDINTVPLIDELKNVEAYIKLQEFRGECTYNYYIDCEESLQQISVPYLILYTFIDNVFKYGIKTKDSFFVMIECRKDTLEDGTPVAVLCVEDNGSGFSEDYLEQFAKKEIHPKEDGHIGLYNIMKTLELMYGRDDLMNIENTITGAKVEVRIIDESLNS